MALPNLIHRPNLGNEFDFGNLVASKIKLKIGAGLARQLDGTIVALPPAITVTKSPTYEYMDIWAEESGAIQTSQSEWSFGNGATGFIGLPVDAGWEVIAMSFHSDIWAAASSAEVHLVDFQGTPTATSPVISTISVTNAGDGENNNAYLYDAFPTPVAVPANAVLGFRTGTISGTVSDGRVAARLRRQTGEHVTDVLVDGVPV